MPLTAYTVHLRNVGIGITMVQEVSGRFREIGFIFNPYDACIANRMVNGNQQTIRFHVDDLMSSHKDPKVNDEFLKWLNDMYGNLGKVKEVRGDVHRYLGMKFVFGEGKVKIDMTNYVKRMLEEFPVKFHKHEYIRTPAGQDMFSADDSKKLDERERELFHRTVAKGLFL